MDDFPDFFQIKTMGKRHGLKLDGVLLLHKPAGISSNHALQRARRTLDAAKAGHTGTLDPFATGLLVCCLGKATKLSGTMLNANKGYRATLRFGQETDSGDLTGQIVAQAQAACTEVDEAALVDVLSRFQGPIVQIPPMYSALKHQGKPLYQYARAGQEVVRAPRQVTIHQLQLVSWTPTTAVIDVMCSKGTYVRTLAQDIGRALGCYAHLEALQRTQVGPFSLEQAIALESLQTLSDPKEVVLSLNALPPGLLAAAAA